MGLQCNENGAKKPVEGGMVKSRKPVLLTGTYLQSAFTHDTHENTSGVPNLNGPGLQTVGYSGGA